MVWGVGGEAWMSSWPRTLASPGQLLRSGAPGGGYGFSGRRGPATQAVFAGPGSKTATSVSALPLEVLRAVDGHRRVHDGVVLVRGGARVGALLGDGDVLGGVAGQLGTDLVAVAGDRGGIGDLQVGDGPHGGKVGPVGILGSRHGDAARGPLRGPEVDDHQRAQYCPNGDHDQDQDPQYP